MTELELKKSLRWAKTDLAFAEKRLKAAKKEVAFATKRIIEIQDQLLKLKK